MVRKLSLSRLASVHDRCRCRPIAAAAVFCSLELSENPSGQFRTLRNSPETPYNLLHAARWSQRMERTPSTLMVSNRSNTASFTGEPVKINYIMIFLQTIRKLGDYSVAWI